MSRDQPIRGRCVKCIKAFEKSRARQIAGTTYVKSGPKTGIALCDPLGYNPDDGAAEQLVASEQQN